MALAITGATGTFAPSFQTIVTPANMSSVPIDGNQYVSYHFKDQYGQPLTLRQASAADGRQAPILQFLEGGQQGSIKFELTQQNVIDIVQGLVNFANSGILS